MKHIVKNNDLLTEFEDWKKQKKVTKNDLLKKNNLPKEQAEIWKKFTKKTIIKEALKTRLLSEQGYICCYCQASIKTSIEHFIPRSKNPSLMFDHDNLLACCSGGELERAKTKAYPLSCGASKKYNEIFISPLDLDCEAHFDYFIIAKTASIQIGVKGKTPEAIKAVEILNLDNEALRSSRGKALEAYFQEDLSLLELKKILIDFEEKILNKSNDKYPEFCIIAINLLKKLTSF